MAWRRDVAWLDRLSPLSLTLLAPSPPLVWSLWSYEGTIGRQVEEGWVGEVTDYLSGFTQGGRHVKLCDATYGIGRAQGQGTQLTPFIEVSCFTLDSTEAMLTTRKGIGQHENFSDSIKFTVLGEPFKM